MSTHQCLKVADVSVKRGASTMNGEEVVVRPYSFQPLDDTVAVKYLDEIVVLEHRGPVGVSELGFLYYWFIF